MDIESDSFLTSINKIDSNLFLGGLLGASNPILIGRNQISAVVSLLSPNAMIVKHRNVRYLEIPIDDLPNVNITRVLPEALNFIKKELAKGSNVLIHCAAGVSRSASVAIAHFMVTYNMTFDQALSKTRKARRCACPNPGFERQLKSLDVRSLKRYLDDN
jgi:protein-tyrosine phosphatase